MPENEICPICTLPLSIHPESVTAEDCRSVLKRIKEAEQAREDREE